MSLTIEDFESDWGECTGVDLSQNTADSGPSLESYHPKKKCNQRDKFLAKTKKIGSIIKMKVWGWNDEIEGIIKSLDFEFDNNMLTAVPHVPIPIGGWYLFKWEITLEDRNNCNNDKVPTMVDKLYFFRIKTEKVPDFMNSTEKLMKNMENKQLVGSFNNKFNDSFVRIETKWWWPKTT